LDGGVYSLSEEAQNAARHPVTIAAGIMTQDQSALSDTERMHMIRKG
jgi:hypothetical protein